VPASTPTDGGDYRNLGASRYRSGQPARVSDIFASYEHADVFSDFSLFSHHPIADARVERPQPFQSVA
jgi:hypothetical protein